MNNILREILQRLKFATGLREYVKSRGPSTELDKFIDWTALANHIAELSQVRDAIKAALEPSEPETSKGISAHKSLSAYALDANARGQSDLSLDKFVQEYNKRNEVK